MAVTDTGQEGIAWETIVASLRNIHERGGWDITPHPMRYGQELFVVLDLEQDELKLVDEHDVRDRPVLLDLELSAHTKIGIGEQRYMVFIGVSDLVRQEMSARVNFLEESAWINSDVFSNYHVWADSPSFVVEVTAKLVELLDNTLQYALPQLS
jgi:hypothetical protein